MTDPCEKGPVIEVLQKTQIEQGAKLDQVLENQVLQNKTMTDALNRLTSMIEADIGTRYEVEQGKKERELLFDFRRNDVARIEAIEIRNAKCDGLGVFKKWNTVWDFIQQEKGWRRFVPAAMTGISFLIVLWATLGTINTSNEHEHTHVPDPRGVNKIDVGVP